MNGADALIETLLANEVDACFANPGTSEMQFVAALDRQPTMRQDSLQIGAVTIASMPPSSLICFSASLAPSTTGMFDVFASLERTTFKIPLGISTTAKS